MEQTDRHGRRDRQVRVSEAGEYRKIPRKGLILIGKNDKG